MPDLMQTESPPSGKLKMKRDRAKFPVKVLEHKLVWNAIHTDKINCHLYLKFERLVYSAY